MDERSLHRVAVLGMGTMGSGIAQVCAQAGLDVVVLEVSQERLADGRSRIAAFLEEGVRRGKVTPSERDAAAARIRGVLAVDELAGADVVIEAVAEDLRVKLGLLERVAAVVGREALIATNTSALSVTEIAAGLPGPERVGGLHFFNPAQLMELVEVVQGDATSPETLAALEALARQLGKDPIVTKDRPGFLVNRLLMPYLNQVVQEYDDGLAEAGDLDAALELGLGYPMGALRMLDLIGLDVHLHATQAAWEQTRDPHLVPPVLLSRMVAAGRLGRKSGDGFYEYAS